MQQGYNKELRDLTHINQGWAVLALACFPPGGPYAALFTHLQGGAVITISIHEPGQVTGKDAAVGAAQSLLSLLLSCVLLLLLLLQGAAQQCKYACAAAAA